MDRTHKPQEAVTLENVSSAWMELGSRGEIRYGVKVYNERPEVAVVEAKQAFADLRKEVLKILEARPRL